LWYGGWEAKIDFSTLPVDTFVIVHAYDPNLTFDIKDEDVDFSFKSDTIIPKFGTKNISGFENAKPPIHEQSGAIIRGINYFPEVKAIMDSIITNKLYFDGSADYQYDNILAIPDRYTTSLSSFQLFSDLKFLTSENNIGYLVQVRSMTGRGPPDEFVYYWAYDDTPTNIILKKKEQIRISTWHTDFRNLKGLKFYSLTGRNVSQKFSTSSGNFSPGLYIVSMDEQQFKIVNH